MPAISRSFHTGVVALLGVVAVLIICGTLQALIPARTVQPLATRFLCDGGTAGIETPAQQGGTAVFTRVTCTSTAGTDDVTGMAFALLAIPVMLILATGTLLVKRLLLATPQTTSRRAPA